MTDWTGFEDIELHDSVEDFVAAVRGAPTQRELATWGLYRADVQRHYNTTPDVITDANGRRWKPVVSARGWHGYVEETTGAGRRLNPSSSSRPLRWLYRERNTIAFVVFLGAFVWACWHWL